MYRWAMRWYNMELNHKNLEEEYSKLLVLGGCCMNASLLLFSQMIPKGE
jgi:hypothetical protein